MTTDTDKRVALITGAASGIGFACARALLRGGTRVVMNDRNKKELGAAKQRLIESEEVAERLVLAVAADVTDSNAVRKMFDQVLGQWGPVLVLVNNAAISGGRKRLGDISDHEWDRMMTANLRGVYLCTKNALPFMVEQRWGRMVNIASIAAVSGQLPASAHYSAAKGGVVAFTKRIAMEAAPHNVAVNCVAPGLIADTGFTEKVRGRLLKQYLAVIPANRAGRCEEIGELVAFLCSEHAGYIVGQTIVVDGGAST